MVIGESVADCTYPDTETEWNRECEDDHNNGNYFKDLSTAATTSIIVIFSIWKK